MMIFTKLLQRFLRKENKVLGRWAVENCDKRINNKIDWSNTDHCGPCGTEKMKELTYSRKSKITDIQTYKVNPHT
jgi:hypothetical protein